MKKVAIIGGGIAGSSIALHLAQLGVEAELFEARDSLVSGPPFCHLHAGGNLYREIDDAQCIKLLEQSIDFIKLYPFAIDYRPTVITVPTNDPHKATDLLARLEKLQKHYSQLIAQDSSNELLGKAEDYYKLYSYEDMQQLSKQDVVAKPSCADEWMIPVAKYVNLQKLQYPIVMVQEYGINMFRVASMNELALQQMPTLKLHLQSKVVDIKCIEDTFYVTFKDNEEIRTCEYDYLINATGFQTGTIDDMLNLHIDRMVEFKSAYVTKWQDAPALFPEIIFHGQRGTPNGMGQFTPYMSKHFQLHGMSKDITLFEDGLVASTPESSQPKLPSHLLHKIEYSWQEDEVESRTNKAIEHISKFIPSFDSAKVASIPLFGAQQIPGKDPELRVAEVSFDIRRYARCEIVKVSSVTDMCDAIIEDMKKYDIISKDTQASKYIDTFAHIDANTLDELSKQIAQNRGYPADMSCIINPN
jgi:hypothetical protein